MTSPLRVPAPKGYLRRSQVKRALDRACLAWTEGRPHAARQVLVDAGLSALWSTFLATAVTWSRANPDRVARVNRVRARRDRAPARYR